MTATEFPLHLVPLPDSALTALGQTLLPGHIYEYTQAGANNVHDSEGDSWIEHLGDDEQRHRWGRVLVQVVEHQVALPGARWVAIRATMATALQGRGRLAAGEELILTDQLAQQLQWLDPEVQLAAHSHVPIHVEPTNALENNA